MSTMDRINVFAHLLGLSKPAFKEEDAKAFIALAKECSVFKGIPLTLMQEQNEVVVVAKEAPAWENLTKYRVDTRGVVYSIR